MNLLDEMAKHRLGDLKVGDDAVFHRPDGDDIAGGAAKHALRLIAHGQNIGGPRLDGDDGRFTQHNALVTDVN